MSCKSLYTTQIAKVTWSTVSPVGKVNTLERDLNDIAKAFDEAVKVRLSHLILISTCHLILNVAGKARTLEFDFRSPTFLANDAHPCQPPHPTFTFIDPFRSTGSSTFRSHLKLINHPPTAHPRSIHLPAGPHDAGKLPRRQGRRSPSPSPTGKRCTERTFQRRPKRKRVPWCRAAT